MWRDSGALCGHSGSGQLISTKLELNTAERSHHRCRKKNHFLSADPNEPIPTPPPQRTFLDTPERARSVHALVTFNYSSIWAKSQWYKRLHISVSQTWLLTSIIKEACLQNTFPGLTPEMLIQVRPLAPLLPEYKAHYKQALYETNIHRTMLSFSCDNHIPVMVQGTELDSHLIHTTPRSSPCPVQAPTVQWVKNHPFVWTLHLLSLVSPPPPLPEFPSAFLLGFL